MGIFNRKPKIKDGKFIREIKIQASVEGNREDIILESMLTGLRLTSVIPGTTNAFTNYDTQVRETYRKYNGWSSFGTQQTRAVIDLRTAFIGGEGVSVSCKDERTADWIEKFLQYNKFTGPAFTEAVKGTEMAGHALFIMKPSEWFDGTLYTKVLRVPYKTETPFRPVFNDTLTREAIVDIEIKRDGEWVSAGFRNFVYVKTGGDDANSRGPTTRVGVVLTDLENYDRAIRDMRRNNHVFARITPHFKTEGQNDATSLAANLAKDNWKIGKSYIGPADLQYKTPGQGAHDNLKTELVSTVKTISSVTGVPVHWLGYVDLMSNRSTAQSLYEMIKNATILERNIWEDSIFELIAMAQEMYVNAGGTELPRIDFEYEVKLPLIDFGEFLNRVRGLSLAFGDEAISMDDYRNLLPGIDPLKTAKAVEEEKKERMDDFQQQIVDLRNQQSDEDEEDENAGSS